MNTLRAWSVSVTVTNEAKSLTNAGPAGLNFFWVLPLEFLLNLSQRQCLNTSVKESDMQLCSSRHHKFSLQNSWATQLISKDSSYCFQWSFETFVYDISMWSYWQFNVVPSYRILHIFHSLLQILHVNLHHSVADHFTLIHCNVACCTISCHFF